MGLIDPPYVSTLAGPSRIGKDIIEALIQDLKFRPGDFVYEQALNPRSGLVGCRWTISRPA